MKFDALSATPHLLLEAMLLPLQGTLFQPTGFPDLGAAEYRLPDGTRMLLVESAQSMANRLEAVCWDESTQDLVQPLTGLPFVRATLPDGSETNSILEAHRLNSPYIVNSPEFEQIKDAVGFEKDQAYDRSKLSKALLRFDPCSLLHGIFLEKIGGVVRIPRALSAFVEARGVEVAPSGGVKFDRVQPESTGDSTKYGKAKDGYGNVPYHRDYYTAETIKLFVQVDLALIRGHRLGAAAERMLIALALYKVQRFVRDGLRLRSFCSFGLDGDVSATQPSGFVIPSLSELESVLPTLISESSPGFNDPPVLTVRYTK